jgi:membrane protease YdiL (CAAX protease family)
MTAVASLKVVGTEGQYSLTKILGIWVAAALPMAILGWVVYPALAAKSDLLGSAVIRVTLLTVGLIWQFVLSMIIVYQEEGDLRWSTIRRRFWLNKPRDPKTGEPQSRLWLWLIPIIALLAAWSIALAPVLDGLWVRVFPFFAEPAGFTMGPVLESPEVQARLAGAWWFLGLNLLTAVFNVFLGEEFLFRGVLLPKMEGVFGKWDWVANGALFAVYHLHQPWGIPGNIVSCVFFFALPAKRFRSNWMSIIPHASEWVMIIPLLFALVLGLA